MGFSNNEEDTIMLCLRICNGLSILGSLSIITMFICFKQLRSHAFKLVFYMSTADLIRAVGFEFPDNEDWLCKTQAVLTSFGSLSGLIWTSIIAFCIYCVVVLEIQDIQKYQFLIIMIGYFLPLIVVMLPFTTDSYGVAGGWCWIKDDEYKILWRIGSFYSVVLVVILFNIWSYYKVIRELRYQLSFLEESPHEINNKNKVFNRFSMYPLIIIFCYVPILCKRLYEIVNNDKSIYVLTVISAVTTSIIGILNAIAYGITDNVKQTIYEFCKKRRSSINDMTINYEPDVSFNEFN